MSNRIFTDVDDLASAVEKHFGKTAVIGIDGMPSAGKTSLGRVLMAKLGVSHYDLDCALEKDRCEYVRALDLEEIRRNIEGRDNQIFVSGVCMLQVMELAQIPMDGLIYVKEMSVSGWTGEEELIDSPLSRLKGSIGGDKLRQEVRNYHALWRPIEHANFEYRRPAV